MSFSVRRCIAVIVASSAAAAGAPAAGGSAAATPPAEARTDVFNGRIAFSSFRTDPAGRTADVFSLNPDGTDLRRLTDNPLDDAQSDWSPDGRHIAYRIRKPETPTRNFDVARMSASGETHQRLTVTPDGQSSSQPAWLPDMRGLLFRWSATGVSAIWQMGPLGENPMLRYDPTPGHQWYPSLSPDMSKVLFATTTSPAGDADRAVQTLNVDGTGLTTLFDVAGAFDSAPAWSPDGKSIAFESNANVDGANPDGDMEIWVMKADGTNPVQLTDNALHDEGPTWSPDGTRLAYSSGVDNLHLDISVMTATGTHLRQLTDHEGRDESPDWQPIPAPPTDRRCGDVVATGPGAHDVRAAGRGLSCRRALRLAARWSAADGSGRRRGRLRRFHADVTDFGGTSRVVLTRHRHHGHGRPRGYVAFLHQR